MFGTDHVLTLAASKQENATVESANKRAQEFLRTMLLVRCTTFGATDYDGRTKRGDWSFPLLPAGGVEAEVALSDWADRMLSTQKVQHNICSGNEIWRIWSSSMVFRHTLTWAHMY